MWCFYLMQIIKNCHVLCSVSTALTRKSFLIPSQCFLSFILSHLLPILLYPVFLNITCCYLISPLVFLISWQILVLWHLHVEHFLVPTTSCYLALITFSFLYTSYILLIIQFSRNISTPLKKQNKTKQKNTFLCC